MNTTLTGTSLKMINKTYACLTPELVAALGLKEGIAKACSGRTTMNALNRGN